jgi:hypothetical protein
MNDEPTLAFRKAGPRLYHDNRSEPVTVDAEGRIFRADGTQFVMPGLEPEKVLRGLADLEAGRGRSLAEIKAEEAIRARFADKPSLETLIERGEIVPGPVRTAESVARELHDGLLDGSIQLPDPVITDGDLREIPTVTRDYPVPPTEPPTSP